MRRVAAQGMCRLSTALIQQLGPIVLNKDRIGRKTDDSNILQVRSNTTASLLTDPYPDNTRRWCKKARKSEERGTLLAACPKTSQFEGHNHKKNDLPHPISSLEHDMPADRPRNIKVDLDIIR